MKWLVVGAGSIGRRHVRNLHALEAGSISVCDLDPQALEATTREFQIKGFRHVGDALDAGPEAVLVCTPTHLHVAMARAALEVGAHVFIEKPLAPSLEGTAELVTLARARRRMVLVGCNMRFHPGVAQLKAALDRGLAGQPLYFRARFSHYLPNWRPGSDYRASYSARRALGGGIVLEGVHEIDYLRWLGGEVVRVAAHISHLSDLEIESEDYALLLLDFESGAAGQIHLDYLSPFKLRGCEVVGADGVLRWSSEGKAQELVRVQWVAGPGAAQEDLYTCSGYDPNLMYLEEMRHFLDCVSGVTTPCLDLEQACRVLALALAGRETGEAGGGWRPVPPSHHAREVAP